MTLRQGKFANNKTAGGPAHLLWYYNLYDANKGFKPNGTEYASVTHVCKQCGEKFQVYKFHGCKWSKILFCCRDCCWQYNYGRPFLDGEENRKKMRKKAWEKHKEKKRNNVT